MAPNKRELADKLKAKANQAYATKHFADAISLYTEAHQLVPAEPVYLSNRAAAHFESGEYAASIVDDKAALELLRGHENVGSEVVGLQASGEQGDLAKTAEAKRLQLLEKVLKRLRRAAIQKRDWEAYQESSRLLSEVEGAYGKSGDVLEDKLVADLLKGICLPEGNVGNGTSSVGTFEGMQSAEASGSSVKPVGDLSSMPVVRGALSSDFAYFPVGHQDPDGLLGNYEDVQMGKSSGGIAPIDVLQLGGRKNAGGKVQPRDVHLRLLFGACGDPRHVIESFYELESQLTGRPVLPTPPKKSKKKEGGSSGSASNKQWGWVSVTCDMNDFDARVLARNVLFLVMLREAGDRRSQEGGRVLDKMRWQIRAGEAKSMPEIVEVQKQWKELHPGLDDRAFFSATHFIEGDVFSLEPLYKVWLSFNLHPDELSVLRSLLQPLLDASSSLPTWQNHPTYSWITFQSQADLETVRSIWKAWLDIANETGEFAHLGGETKLEKLSKG